jgi:hypothetical protein
MTADQLPESEPGSSENRSVSDKGSTGTATKQKGEPKKGKKVTEPENVVYMTIEEDDDPIHVRIRRIIQKVIDQYVTTHKMPIRRKKLKNLVFSYDDEMAKFYEEEKEVAVAIFNFAVTRLVKEKKIIRVKDPEKKKYTYYILPKHLEMFGINMVIEPDQGKPNGGQRT